jgi:hypothetical protein
MGIKLNIWKSQNAFYGILKSYKNEEWVFVSKAWQESFIQLATLLKVQM